MVNLIDLKNALIVDWFGVKVKGCESVVCGKRTRIRDKFFWRFKEYKVSCKDNNFI